MNNSSVKSEGSWILGLGGSDHDFSAALARGFDIRVAIEQERLSRAKHGLSVWYRNPVQQCVDYCLQDSGVAMDDIESIVACDTIPALVRAGLADRQVRLFPHHLCHAASAYLMLPVGARAAILVYDGYGSSLGSTPGDTLRHTRETFSFFEFSRTGYRHLGSTKGMAYSEGDDFPKAVTNSIGMLYELGTALLGYDPMDSGKTMGLSPYGAPRHVRTIEEFIQYGSSTQDCFRCDLTAPALQEALIGILNKGRGRFSAKADLAASLQAVVNKTLRHCITLFEPLAADYICVTGGCGLNTVANASLAENTPRDTPIAIPPHCGDAGLGFGAIWLEHFRRHGTAPAMTFRSSSPTPTLSRPGRLYSKRERDAAAQQFYPRLSLDCSVTSAHQLARKVASGSIVGLFNGRSEIGPRALGGRSIIADPRAALTREKINRSLKGREPFRPLAPIVLGSRYAEYFIDDRQRDPFMLKIARVTERCKLEAPAIVHVDGTARVQVVDEDGDPLLVELLRAFEQITGVPVLINTSFNRRGEPIVETPDDAIDAFLGMGLDGLYLDGDFYVAARPISPSS